MNQQSAINQIIEYGIDQLDNVTAPIEAADLHNRLYNEDYFIIGYYQADQFLAEYGTMSAIRNIQEYEEQNFGEINTDLGDSEKVAGMLAYIIGEEVLNNCPTLTKNWDGHLSSKQLTKIRHELEAQIK